MAYFKAAVLIASAGIYAWKYMKEHESWFYEDKSSDNEGRWNISNKEIKRGKNGTIIFEGSYGAREAAVKRLVKTNPDVGSQEYEIYVKADKLKNIVRCYGKECDKSYVYLFLELCSYNLVDLIQMSRQRINYSANAVRNITLWKEDGHPSPPFIKIMRDVVQGLMDLHKNNIVHRDLKPQNILITGTAPNFCAKLSDMSKAVCKSPLICHSTHCRGQQFYFEWEAAKDVYNLGHVLYFCINGGTQPFGVIPRREFLDNLGSPEAIDLIRRLCSPETKLRPKVVEVYRHPFFWDPDMKLSFLRDVSDMAEEESRKNKLAEAFKNIRHIVIGHVEWNTKIDPAFRSWIEDSSRSSKRGRQKFYRYNDFQDLLRLVRNSLNHYKEIPKEIQELLGRIPEGYYDYFAKRFPKLLIAVYKVVHNLCEEEERFQKYFNPSIVE